MRSRRLFGLGPGAFAAGLAAFACGMIFAAPATLFDRALASGSDGRLRLVEARGTLWSGVGRLEARTSGGRADVASALGWQFLPRKLLRGQLAYDVSLHHEAGRIHVALSPWSSRIELADADIVLPAAVLGVAAPQLAPLQLTGRLRMRIARLSIMQGKVQGDVMVTWQEAGSALTSVFPLGDYELRFNGAGDESHVVLRTTKGGLRLDGTSRWKTGERPVLPVTARVSPQHRAALAPFLRLIAVERGDGGFEMQAR